MMTASGHIDLPCPIRFRTPDDAQHFVGFHDICPWAPGADVLAVHRIPKGYERTPLAEDTADICVWDPARGTVVKVGETQAWNLQQGSRLQWLPGQARTLVWNERRGTKFVGVLLDLETNERREAACSIYALHPGGRKALTPSFARLGKYYPSYGYAGGTAPGLHAVAPAEDGIWGVDLEADRADLLVSIDRVAGFGGLVIDPPVPHFLTHPTWNPSGDRFCFIHRYFTAHGEMMSRLFVADADGQNLVLVSDDRVSHFDWHDDDTICVWARIGMKQLGSLRNKGILQHPMVRPLVKLAKSLRPDLKRRLNNAGYWSIDVQGRRPPELVIERIEDGHQMFSGDKRWMLTDTYPDQGRVSTLMLFDLQENRIYDVAKLHSPVHADHDHRCDLHPRWNRGSDLMCVDNDADGFRRVLVIDPAPVFAAAGAAGPGADRGEARTAA
ncbi:MAG TPA: hypothetical protein VED40_11385 [Azospirillaceae bacterium]|nr:hypothetical protein [Azospirillaceae bacterium]